MLGYAAQTERIAAPRGEFAQRLYCGAQLAGADRENEGRLAVIAELGEHAVAAAGGQLLEVLVPDVDIAEIVVGAGAVLTHHDLVHPGLVGELYGSKSDHEYLSFAVIFCVSIYCTPRGSPAAGRRDLQRSPASSTDRAAGRRGGTSPCTACRRAQTTGRARA